MTDIPNNVNEKSTADLNVLNFERKLVELVEEVRLRRNLEVESEKTLKSIMDEKYEEELSWDEQVRRYVREKEDLEQQIELLKRKLEDKVCVSDEDKATQQVMNKTYSHEIRLLKEELRASKSEKLNLQKKIQELEGKLTLHDNFQDRIMNQISEVRKMMKTIFEESKELINSQRQMMENVASAKSMFKKLDLCNEHLQQSIKIYGKKNETLKKELISSRSEISLLKQSESNAKEKKNDSILNEIEKYQKKVLELENLLLTSRQENMKTLNNFLESNKLLCKFMDKYSEFQQREKKLTTELQLLQENLHTSQSELRKTTDVMEEIQEKVALKEKERIKNQCSAATQTESACNQYCSCSKALLKSSDDTVNPTLTSFIPKAMEKNFMDEFRNSLINLEQNALVMQSEMSVNNGIHSFSLDQLCVNSADKKITLSQVLKRKLEVMESGDQIEMIAMKKKFTENMTQSMTVVNNGVERNMHDKMLISCETSNQPLCNNFNSIVSVNLPSLKEDEMLISQKANCQPLCNKSNSVLPLSYSKPPVIQNEMVMSHDINDQSLCHVLNQEISSAHVKNEIPIPANCQPLCNKSNSVIPLSFSKPPINQNEIVMSHEINDQSLCSVLNQEISSAHVKNKFPTPQETYGQPSCSNLDLGISLCPPSGDILLDQKYLSYKKFPGKFNEKDENKNVF